MSLPDVRTAGCNRPNAEDTKADAAIVSQAACLDKSFATLQALADLAGCGLHELSSGAYLLTRWGQVKECPDLRAVAALLQHMGVRA